MNKPTDFNRRRGVAMSITVSIYSFTDPGGMEGWVDRPWCEVAPAEILTRNLPIASPTLYHTATSAPDSLLNLNVGYSKWRLDEGVACAVRVLLVV